MQPLPWDVISEMIDNIREHWLLALFIVVVWGIVVFRRRQKRMASTAQTNQDTSDVKEDTPANLQ